MQLDPRDSPLTNEAGLAQRREVPSLHGAGQQLSLRFKVASVGCGQPLLERGQVFKVATDRHMLGVV